MCRRGEMRAITLIESFLQSRAAKNCRPKTISWYGMILYPFARDFPELPARPEMIEAYLAPRGPEPETKHAYYRGLRAFYRWAHRRYEIKDIMESVDSPRVPRKVMRTLDLAELFWLQAAARTPRDLALIGLFIDSGIREGEASNLDFSNIGSDWITVRGKTGERIVGILPETVQELMALGNTGPVFLSQRGGRLTPQGTRKAVKRCFRRAGLDGKRATPHTLRHSFARACVISGMSQAALQGLLGHESPEMTRRYVRLFNRDFIEAHHRHTPRRLLAGGLQQEMFQSERAGESRPWNP